MALFVGMTVYFYAGSIHEERLLDREFGSAYRDYAKQVPRIIPRPGRYYRRWPTP